MGVEINDELLMKFISEQLDLTDFGYLVVPKDERLNAEAAATIQAKFHEWLANQ